MIDFIGGLIVGLILMREWYKLKVRAETIQYLLAVVFTRKTMTLEQIADGLRKIGQLNYFALYLCLLQMLNRGEIEWCGQTETYRLKGGM